MTAPPLHRSHGCRFIAGDPRELAAIGEAIYCGRPVERIGEAWCAEHRAICYRELEPRTKQQASPPADIKNAA